MQPQPQWNLADSIEGAIEVAYDKRETECIVVLNSKPTLRAARSGRGGTEGPESLVQSVVVIARNDFPHAADEEKIEEAGDEDSGRSDDDGSDDNESGADRSEVAGRRSRLCRPNSECRRAATRHRRFGESPEGRERKATIATRRGRSRVRSLRE